MAIRHPYHRGDVMLIEFPFSDESGQKRRPALVISTDTYHDEWDELLVVAITSQPPRRIRPTDYGLQDWQSAGLQRPSWIRSHLATVHRRLIVQKVGSLSPIDLSAVEACLSAAIAL